ncbi:GreA/GreB family elongation factor [Frigoriflavimonas asaccharolytica]|uniref:Transcription elongation GreA/GreB family factor n=1 Tax=Frigoriflavimonas asaccharolytica TaxID=2735899 RepID=A0A8J8G8X4_9FLAO|nr:hypothetical protein [Frigoriflavimonas asaccharolytica]NRS93096.1 transcription elongation GreA/GreB family factor [Frigoriflavimonas asaccharolytica]
MKKSEILNIVHEKLDLKIKTLENLIAETRASNNETKSSMGDKYETTREMVQQEINNLQVQLNENLRAKTVLKNVSTDLQTKVKLGSLVETENGFFYIAISLGDILFNGKKIYLISEESPLAKAMIGFKSGEIYVLNNVKQKILKIW